MSRALRPGAFNDEGESEFPAIHQYTVPVNPFDDLTTHEEAFGERSHNASAQHFDAEALEYETSVSLNELEPLSQDQIEVERGLLAKGGHGPSESNHRASDHNEDVEQPIQEPPKLLRAWLEQYPDSNYGVVVLVAAVLCSWCAAPGHSFVMGIFTEVPKIKFLIRRNSAVLPSFLLITLPSSWSSIHNLVVPHTVARALSHNLCVPL